MTHPLDRPAWNALATTHSDIAEGSPLARRYSPSIVPFAAMANEGPESLAALAALPRGDEMMALVEAGPITVPPILDVVMEGKLVQMIREQPCERIDDPRVVPLGEADAQDMLELATLTKPGPFTLKAQSLGTFWGVKIEGRLVAMAGQRMRQAGYGELSGLCTHPDVQGRGFGTLLFRFAAGEISSRGDAVFLHAFSTNTAAISLYKRLGFTIRTEMNLRAVKRRA